LKLIKCVIRPEKTEEVVAELQQVVAAMTVTEVRGHGRQKGQPLSYRGVEYDVSLLPKTMIDMVADDNKVDEIVQVLAKSARTGNIGDGRIFILPVEESYHIRTGFMDLD
jgi:nitrogen regulatory protein PII